MTFEAQAPFAKHKFKLKMFEGSAGDYFEKLTKLKLKKLYPLLPKYME